MTYKQPALLHIPRPNPHSQGTTSLTQFGSIDPFSAVGFRDFEVKVIFVGKSQELVDIRGWASSGRSDHDKPVKPDKYGGPVKPVEPLEPVKPVQGSTPVRLVQGVESAVKPVEVVEVVEVVKVVEVVEVLDPVQTVVPGCPVELRKTADVGDAQIEKANDTLCIRFGPVFYPQEPLSSASQPYVPEDEDKTKAHPGSSTGCVTISQVHTIIRLHIQVKRPRL
ncbi:hypothetical protein JCM11251_000282 [Rhodosporidiobolus azoricus]